MKDFIFHAPTKIIFGRESHLKTGEIIKGYGYKKVMLHYGQGSVKNNGLYDQVIRQLEACGIDHVPLGGVEPNPKLSFVKKGVEICRKENCDMILALGGGSVIDSAKAIAVSVPSGRDPWDFSSKKALPESSLPLGVILTLSASGSEMSASAVITNEEGLLKRGYNSEFNRPLFSVLNPELTYSVNKYHTGCGVVDIMMHTLERYFCDPEKADITDQMAEGLLKSVIEAGRIAINKPDDYEARANLMWAGSLSHNDLMGLGREVFMSVHQMEHELSGMYDFVPHGAGLSVLFTAWLKFMYKHNLDRFCQYAVRVWGVPYDERDQEKTALAGIKATEDYFTEIGMPTRLSAFDIQDIRIEEMAEKCTFWGSRTLPGYVDLGKKEIMEIFNLAR